MTSVDERIKRLIARFEVEDGDEGTHVAAPLKWLFFLSAIFLFLPAALAAIYRESLSPKLYYILANSSFSTIICSFALGWLFVYSDLWRLVCHENITKLSVTSLTH